MFEKLNEVLGNVRVFATDEMSRKALRGIEEDEEEVCMQPASTLAQHSMQAPPTLVQDAS